MIALSRRLYFMGAYYFSWVLFLGVGLGLSVFSMPLLLLPRRASRGQWMRAIIRRLFDLWVTWLHLSKVVRVNFNGFDAPLPTGAVYIANHPTLVDATFLLARLPDTICIFKPALMRNPALGPPAIMAGYVAGNAGVDLVREVAQRITAGCSLLVFPEGTRTAPGQTLGEMRPGFALMATRARAPVQLVLIRSTPALARRGLPWWRAPAILPATVDLTLDRRWDPDAARTAAQLAQEVELHLRKQLGSGVS